jgi:DNA-binding response OmpR family regulator
MMPGMDGKTTLRNSCKIAGLEHVSMICLTAKLQQYEIGELNSSVGTDVVPKPFDPMALARQI